MYNVSVGPSKIVAKTRRGISQNLESLQNFSKKPNDFDNGEVVKTQLSQHEKVQLFQATGKYLSRMIGLSSKASHHLYLIETVSHKQHDPRPVFHTNSKKCSNIKQQEIISPQHEELIRFVSESWRKIFKEYESEGIEEPESFCANNSSIIYYEDPEPNAFLQNFKPFDLESWWGKRLFNNITKSVP